MTTAIILGVVTILNFLAIFAMIFWERKSPSSTLIWVLTMSLIPVFGFLLYLFIGEGPRFGRHQKFLKKIEEDENYIKEASDQSYLVATNGSDFPSVASFVQLNLKQSGSICAVNNGAKIYTDINLLYDQIFIDIKAAKETINLEYFIFKPDNLGKKVLNALVEKASQGVKVKVVYDDLGALETKKKFFKPLIKAGGEVARFFASKIRLLNFNINYRNHRKLIIIDNLIAYTGGANIGDEYLGLSKKIKPWRDTHIRVCGDIASLMNVRFISDFSFAYKKDIDIDTIIKKKSPNKKKIENKNAFATQKNIASENLSAAVVMAVADSTSQNSVTGLATSGIATGLAVSGAEATGLATSGIATGLATSAADNTTQNLPMQLVVSGPDTKSEEIKSAYLKAIYSAKKRILLQSPYFIPDEAFIEALKNAALSGVDVCLMIPKLPDKKFVYYATFAYAKELINYGIKVYLYHGFIHSKTLQVDDEISSIGTFNLDMRSFNLHFEDTLFIYDQTFSGEMIRIFENDILSSTLLTAEYIKKRPKRQKLLEKFSRLFTPLF